MILVLRPHNIIKSLINMISTIILLKFQLKFHLCLGILDNVDFGNDHDLVL